MTRTTPELTPPPSFRTTPMVERLPPRMVWGATGLIHDGSSVESGFEPGIRGPQSRDLTTKPPRPPRLKEKKTIDKVSLLSN
ncbi:hypothetical protein AVEN_167301-1 [Araneus ventricosus]|uniref:Uncharacterized protein n=1 Tax=Araneus ventricosus TaxID=182803 RepID=A0A4Y2DEC0_ARAVE|nr:hypothetical protein AVEN_167301-1 [Araneus ventricosus]